MLSRRGAISFAFCCCFGLRSTDLAATQSLAFRLQGSNGCEPDPSDFDQFTSVHSNFPSNGDADVFSSLRRTSGDSKMDLLLDRALKKLADTFEVYPAFGFYEDGESPNAWATSKQIVAGKTDGAVGFGQNYFRKWMAYDPSGLSVLATCAHEFAHIMQFKSRRYSQIRGGLATSKRTELHADYLSGYYIGLLKKQSPDASFWRAGDKFRQIGSNDDKDPMFHGTPTERVAASQHGFIVGFYEGRDSKFAFESGVKYVVDR